MTWLVRMAPDLTGWYTLCHEPANTGGFAIAAHLLWNWDSLLWLPNHVVIKTFLDYNQHRNDYIKPPKKMMYVSLEYQSCQIHRFHEFTARSGHLPKPKIWNGSCLEFHGTETEKCDEMGQFFHNPNILKDAFYILALSQANKKINDDGSFLAQSP